MPTVSVLIHTVRVTVGLVMIELQVHLLLLLQVSAPPAGDTGVTARALYDYQAGKYLVQVLFAQINVVIIIIALYNIALGH